MVPQAVVAVEYWGVDRTNIRRGKAGADGRSQHIAGEVGNGVGRQRQRVRRRQVKV